MILVDIYVPSIDETFDFQLDENVPVRLVTEEITEMLRRKTAGRADRTAESFALCSYEPGDVLAADKTLRESGVRNGSRLFIV